MSGLNLQARWVLPADQLPIERGVVSIRAGHIVSVGPPVHLGAVHDLGDVVLLPGLINAHTHLEFSLIGKPLGRPGMALPDWIRLVLGERKGARREPSQAIRAGLEESLRLGVTTVGEIATVSAGSYGQGDDGLPSLTLFDEVIGFSEARVDSVLAAATGRLTACLERPSVRCSPGLSPHAPYTVHPRLLDGLIELANTHQLPVAMHLAESLEEIRLLIHGDGAFRELLDERSMWDATAIRTGTCVLDYLVQLARAPRCLVVHGNYLNKREVDYLARHHDRMTVVYCPRTHAYFGHGVYPLAAMLDAGVRVALGTDSRASSPDLSLLAELREVARSHSGIPPAQIVRLGTLAGAWALGLREFTGSITPGKWANLTAIPCDSRCKDPYAAVLEGERAPMATWLGGELVHCRSS